MPDSTPNEWRRLVEACFAEVIAAANGTGTFDPQRLDALPLVFESRRFPMAVTEQSFEIGTDLDVALDEKADQEGVDPGARPAWMRVRLVGDIAHYLAKSIHDTQEQWAAAAEAVILATPTGQTLTRDEEPMRSWCQGWRYMPPDDWSLLPWWRIRLCPRCREHPPVGNGHQLCDACGGDRACEQCGESFPLAQLSAGRCRECNWDYSFSSHSERADTEIAERESERGADDDAGDGGDPPRS